MMELRVDTYHDWLWIPMLLLFVFLAFIFTKYHFQIRRCFLAVVSNREFSDLMRDESQTAKRSSLALNVFSLFTYSFFLFLFAVKFLNWELIDLNLYLVINAAVFGAFILKYIFILLVGILFQEQKSADLYISNSLLSNKVLGIVLFPLSLVVAYSMELGNIFLISTLFLWGIITVFKWYQGIKLGLSLSELPIIYPFLYICTLEILPTMILIKIFLEPLKNIIIC